MKVRVVQVAIVAADLALRVLVTEDTSWIEIKGIVMRYIKNNVSYYYRTEDGVMTDIEFGNALEAYDEQGSPFEVMEESCLLKRVKRNGKYASSVCGLTYGVCMQCKKSAKKRCGACNLVYYCSAKCQRVHWKRTHKIDCSCMKRRSENNSILLSVGGDKKRIEKMEKRYKSGLV